MENRTEHKILIGGKALNILGSKRHTDDTDYLVFDSSSKEMFINENGYDLLNANGSKFFAELYEAEKENQIASPQTLLELKAYAWVQHYQNFNFQKADDAEYDIKFLVRNCEVKELRNVKNYIAEYELNEVVKIIESVKF